jgi:hypothetical protein
LQLTRCISIKNIEKLLESELRLDFENKSRTTEQNGPLTLEERVIDSKKLVQKRRNRFKQKTITSRLEGQEEFLGQL